jgi:gluconolactonase
MIRMYGPVAGLLLACGAVHASEVTVVSNVLGPEGPLVVDGTLYYVGWISSTLAKWDGKSSTVLDSTAHCGHNGLALTPRKTLLVACDEQGAIMEMDLAGKRLRRWDSYGANLPMTGGINDLVVAADGGAYATLSGPFDDPPVGVVGKVLYLAPGAQKWVEVAGDFNYANGIALSPDQKTLYVCETVGNSIKKFSVHSDGTLGDRANFALLNLLVPNKVESWWIGPDSMKVDRHGNVYVAQFSGGKVLKISPQGKLLHVFNIAAGDGTTNVAFDAAEKNIYVTVVKDPKDPKAVGSIVRIPNAP